MCLSHSPEDSDAYLSLTTTDVNSDFYFVYPYFHFLPQFFLQDMCITDGLCRMDID